jgi:hypothetical protein
MQLIHRTPNSPQQKSEKFTEHANSNNFQNTCTEQFFKIQNSESRVDKRIDKLENFFVVIREFSWLE